ncbi:hypothetical protein CQY20_20600 [Mycolicibacterium agri]|uniref:Uncharacterized protein n=1 Tax=Mycolicibacterium agri TaxID=36811 RepID=A0A2A7MXP3_MYCAG|nr:hypothetical protein CQY20_20600 [Mycolicibacterium agri]
MCRIAICCRSTAIASSHGGVPQCLQLHAYCTHMNQAVFAFRRYEDASLLYTGIDSHEGLSHFGLYDTVVARES